MFKTLCTLTAWLAVSAAPAAWAQAAWPRLDPAPTARAADPASPVRSLVYVSSLPTAPAVETGKLDWRRANDAVGQFPNGHADLFKLENPAPAAAPATAVPAHSHSHSPSNSPAQPQAPRP